MTPRNGGPGRVWEAIRAMIEYTVVGTGGTLALDIEPQGLLGAQTAIAHSGCRGSGPQGIFAVQPELLVPFTGEWAA